MSGILSYPRLILILSLFFSGFFRVYVIVPYLIVTQYFDAADHDKAKISIWYSIQSMGDVFAILFTAYLLQVLEWSWQDCLMANLLVFFVLSILMCLTCEEVRMNEAAIVSERGTN